MHARGKATRHRGTAERYRPAGHYGADTCFCRALSHLHWGIFTYTGKRGLPWQDVRTRSTLSLKGITSL